MLQKYFIAIVPPEPLLSAIRDIKQQICDTYGTKGALRSPAHITLHMPFSWEEEREEKLIAALGAFSYAGPIQTQLNGFACFEPRVVYIHVEESEPLLQLQQQLVKHVMRQLQLFNQSDDRRGFHPHITVAFRDLKKAVFYRLWEDYQHEAWQAAFQCRSFCLLKHTADHWQVFREFSFC